MPGSCNQCNEPSGSVRGEGFLYYLLDLLTLSSVELVNWFRQFVEHQYINFPNQIFNCPQIVNSSEII